MFSFEHDRVLRRYAHGHERSEVLLVGTVFGQSLGDEIKGLSIWVSTSSLQQHSATLTGYLTNPGNLQVSSENKRRTMSFRTACATMPRSGTSHQLVQMMQYSGTHEVGP